MKRLIILFAAGGLFTCIFSQHIFRTNLEGMAAQSFVSTENIDGFTVSGPDGEGYVYLVAHAGAESGEVARTRWQGSGFQEFTLPAGSYVTGFGTSGPDASGYVYLVASASNGDTASIIKSRWQGSAVQEYSPSGEDIKALNATSSGDGYVYLSAGSVGIEEDPDPGWIQPPEFALRDMGSPCYDAARISYSLAEPCRVTIRIYDSSGRLLTKLADEERGVGSHELVWYTTDSDGRRASSGVYFIQMSAGSFTACKKITVLR